MGKYGKCATVAVATIQSNKTTDPVTAWDKAVFAIFPDSESSRKKGCPKNAFLGLCEAGIVKGVRSGSYTKSLDNKKYAIDAVNLLKRNPHLSKKKQILWGMVEGNSGKKHNAQMDVVISLWDNGMIETAPL